MANPQFTKVVKKLNSQEYVNARKSIKDRTKHLKRLEVLLGRIMTRIEKINSFLREDDLEDKELKSKISLLSQLLGVKKQIKSEIKSLDSKQQNKGLNIGDILSN